MQGIDPGIDPLKYFARTGRHSETIPIKQANGQFSTGSDQTLISGVSGKRMRVMGWFGQSNTSTVGFYQFEDTNGDLCCAIWAPPNTSAGQLFPITESGYFETTTGDPLRVDVGTAIVNIGVWYIEYTP